MTKGRGGDRGSEAICKREITKEELQNKRADAAARASAAADAASAAYAAAYGANAAAYAASSDAYAAARSAAYAASSDAAAASAADAAARAAAYTADAAAASSAAAARAARAAERLWQSKAPRPMARQKRTESGTGKMSIPQVIITLSPSGDIVAELPGPFATRRQIALRAGHVEQSLRKMLEAQQASRTEIGTDGAPTIAQVRHWECHEIWPDERCKVLHRGGAG